MADLRALARWCSALPDRIDRGANEVAKAVVIRMAENLIDHTPVDVTTAVSNWQASINAPAMFGFDAIVPGRHGSTAPASRAEALAHVTRVVADKRPGEPIYLSNLTPYLVYLNQGSSQQEPAGFFERGVVVGAAYLATAKLGITG